MSDEKNKLLPDCYTNITPGAPVAPNITPVTPDSPVWLDVPDGWT